MKYLYKPKIKSGYDTETDTFIYRDGYIIDKKNLTRLEYNRLLKFYLFLNPDFSLTDKNVIKAYKFEKRNYAINEFISLLSKEARIIIKKYNDKYLRVYKDGRHKDYKVYTYKDGEYIFLDNKKTNIKELI